MTEGAAGRPLALVLDFDGTSALRDIGDQIVLRFLPDGAARLGALNARVAAGELDLVALQRELWPLVRCGESELRACLAEVGALRPGLDALTRAALRSGARLVIASGGFELYIRVLLGPLAEALVAEEAGAGGARVESPWPRLGPFELIANGMEQRGGALPVSFPYLDTLGCGRCSVCKGLVLDRLAREGFRTVFCGDGLSDRCAIGRADTLCCVEGSRLHRWAAAEGAPHIAFSHFDEVRRALGG